MNNNCKNAFKAYDIRGKYPEELNEDIAYLIGQAYTTLFNPQKVVLGHDVRTSSPSLTEALAKGLKEGGCDVINIGLCGTEQVYFTTFHLQLDGGIMVTASHNPQGYNGMKLVRAGSCPISGDSGLKDLEQMVVSGNIAKSSKNKGSLTQLDITDSYIKHLLSYVDTAALRPLKVVANAGNGCAGPIIDALEPYLPFKFIKVNHQPDGNFPNGIPNPLLPENRESTASAVKETGADVGIAWDGDFDRCFLFDEQGTFIEGYYIVGLLAESFLTKYPGAKIIHDPRLTWNTIDIIKRAKGVPIQSKTGHAFIKERMRLEDAVYGGEMSAHHYFKDFAYCDSGMIPWLLILEIMCREKKSLSTLICDRMKLFPASGEINRMVANPIQVMKQVESKFANKEAKIDRTDGLSVEYPNWRFNLRMSNTEPVIRLNVEAKGDGCLMEEKTKSILSFIDSLSSKQ
ncbi:MAG: phosphomannomutase [Bacillota bacterium]